MNKALSRPLFFRFNQALDDYMVTDASVHDPDKSRLETLVDRTDAGQKLCADSAYVGQEESVDWCGMSREIQVRARVEHVFGYMTNSVNAMYIRTIGYARAAAKIGLANLTYNLMRCVQLNKKCMPFSWDNYAL